MIYYLLVFFSALLVDLLPFFGPPAWTVMVFFQMKYDLNIWWVLIAGVTSSTIGRYVLSKYIYYLSARFITTQKMEDISFIGEKLSGKGWNVQLFVLLYTLMPLPSTPLFTAVGIAKIRAINILPAFFIGKFTSDMIMVLSGDYVAKNAINISQGIFSWQSISGAVAGIIIILIFLFIDWRKLLQFKQFKLKFNIFK